MSVVKGLCLLLAVLMNLFLSSLAQSTERTWTDKSGKHSIEAALVRVDGKIVVLTNTDGKEIRVPLAKLSKVDQDFVKKLALSDAQSPADPAEELVELTIAFYKDLRTEHREVACGMLSAEATKAAEKYSPVKVLPTPDKSRRALRAGRAKIHGDVAEVPMQVRAGGEFIRTKLHFRNENQAWKVFAISATFPDGEKTLNFEAAPRAAGEDNPLEKLVGNKVELTGYTLEGRPFELRDYRGKVVLIDFWATWCGPCRAEIPNILANWEQYHEAGFEVLAVSVDRDLESLQEFVTSEAPPWTVLADSHPKNRTSMAAQYGVSGIPAFVLVGQTGEVVAVNCRGKLLGTELAKLFGDIEMASPKLIPRRRLPLNRIR